jgi:KDO2-lipid IV(A) lauroyltransferase
VTGWRGPASAALERGLLHPLRVLPSGAGSAVGEWLGRRVVPGLYPVATARARAALARLRPDLDTAAALEEAWANIGASFAEMPRLLRFWEEGRIAVQGEAHLLAARRAGQPVICAWLHTGNPEVLGLTLGKLGLGPVGVAERQPTGFRERVVTALRTGYGGRLILADRGAMRPALEVLRAGPAAGTLVFAMDETAGGRVRGPSLGRGAPPPNGNMALAARLAALAGAAVVPGYVTRLPGGGAGTGRARFLTTFLPPVALPARSGERARDAAAGAAAIDAVADPVVRALLPQWLQVVAWREEECGQAASRAQA